MLLVAIALLSLPHPARPAPPEGTLVRAGEELAARLSAAQSEPGLVALVISAPKAQSLATPLEAAIGAALARRGLSIAPLHGSDLVDTLAAARKLKADRLLRVLVVLASDRAELSMTIEELSIRPSFFLQRAPQVRSGGDRLWSFVLPADPATLALARTSPRYPLQAAAVMVKPLFQVANRILALGAGDAAGDGSVAIAVVTPSAISLYGLNGTFLARRDLEMSDRVRRPAAAIAIGNFPGGRIAIQFAGGKPGEVISFRNGELRSEAPLAEAPLAALGEQLIFGSFLPGRATFAEDFTTTQRPSQGAPSPRERLPPEAASPRPSTSPRELMAFRAARRPGRVTFAALYSDGSFQLLGPNLATVGAPLLGIGAGFALADLDGDGEPELVASLADTGPTDRIRLLRLRPSGAVPVFESEPIAGSILTGATADMTGDGFDDALLASVTPVGGSQIWLVSTDSRLVSDTEGAAP